MKISNSATSKALLTLFVLGICCQQLLVVQSLDFKPIQQKPRQEKGNHEGHELKEEYSFDQVWELMYEDMMRWLAIFEDVVAESTREQFFDGIVDRKTVKRALRFFARNIMASMKNSGFMDKISGKEVKQPEKLWFSWSPQSDFYW